MSFSCNVSHADTFHPHLMMCTNMTTILSHQDDLGPSMLDVKYEGLGGTGLVTTPLNMAPNLSECNVSHGGIALYHWPNFCSCSQQFTSVFELLFTVERNLELTNP